VRILPTIVTTSYYNHSLSGYAEKIKEACLLGLEEVCFFPAAIDKKERRKAYRLLEKNKVKAIPFVHLRH